MISEFVMPYLDSIPPWRTDEIHDLSGKTILSVNENELGSMLRMILENIFGDEKINKKSISSKILEASSLL